MSSFCKSLFKAAVRGFGSWHCFGLRMGCGAMASAKSVGENLFRLQCGGYS